MVVVEANEWKHHSRSVMDVEFSLSWMLSWMWCRRSMEDVNVVVVVVVVIHSMDGRKHSQGAMDGIIVDGWKHSQWMDA